MSDNSAFETVVVPKNERLMIDIGDGETLANVLYDITAPGALVGFQPAGSEWEMRNIGVRGGTRHRFDADPKYPRKIIHPWVADGSTGLVENVYLGDGVGFNELSRDGGLMTRAYKHKGDLTLRNLHVAGWADNGVYASNAARRQGPGKGGNTFIERCFGRNNNTASFRIGSDGDYIRESVAIVDGPMGRKPRPVPGSPGEGRAVWVRDGGEVEITGCDFEKSHKSGTRAIVVDDESTARITNTEISGWDIVEKGDVRRKNIGSDPDITPPPGTPMTALEAASGGLKPKPPNQQLNHIVVLGMAGINRGGFNYEIHVPKSSNLWPGSEATREDKISSDQRNAQGRVWGTWFDDFFTDADPSDIDVTSANDSLDDLAVIVDGEPLPIGFAFRPAPSDKNRIERAVRSFRSDLISQLQGADLSAYTGRKEK